MSINKEIPAAEAAAEVATEKVVDKETPVAEAAADVTTEKVEEQKVDTTAEKAEEIAVFPATEKVESTITNKFDKEAGELFESYPDNTAFHFTSDGLAFFQQSDARNHASSLEDKEVITKVRK